MAFLNRCVLAATLMLAACGGGQSAVCKQLLECYESVQAGSSAGIEDTYGPNGSCWSQGNEYADVCSASCNTTLSSYRTNYPNVPACQ